MVLERGTNGSAIAVENYFFQKTLDPHEVINASSFCEARQKLKWEAFRFLLNEVNLTSRLLGESGEMEVFKRVFAVDGATIVLPCSEDILSEFPKYVRRPYVSHYPRAMMVTATNVCSGIPLCTHLQTTPGHNERRALFEMLDNFDRGDIVLLDQGFCGRDVMSRLRARGIDFIMRVHSGAEASKEVRKLLSSSRKESEIVIGNDSNSFKVRLVKAGKDREGLTVVLAVSLPKEKESRKRVIELYHRRWSVETMYFKVKSLLSLESFHTKTLNGIKQEVWANLFVLGLTSLLTNQAAWIKGVDQTQHQINFKRVLEVTRRHVVAVIESQKTGQEILVLLHEIIEQVVRAIVKKRPGRHYPRISHKRPSKWGSIANRNKHKVVWDKEKKRRVTMYNSSP